MLNRIKLLSSLQSLESSLFNETDFSAHAIAASWQSLASAPTFADLVAATAVAHALPTWVGSLSESIDVSLPPAAYRVISIDGSQIYPDRHTGVSCFLINIGTVDLSYGSTASRVLFDSVPHLFVGDEVHALGAATQELVNCRRQEYELDAGVAYIKTLGVQESLRDHQLLPASHAEHRLMLFDGSLIFWHLASKEYELRSTFLHRYITALEAFYAAAVPCAWYISLPKSKELVNLLRYAIDVHQVRDLMPHTLDAIVDAQIVAQFLPPYHRTVVFQSNIALCMAYPAHLRPHFFYLHCGEEIGRVEIPAWLASDASSVDALARMLIDQARKGFGYPIALAEAHEQAVVKGVDRDFFYHCIEKLSVARKKRLATSLKSRKKRGMGI